MSATLSAHRDLRRSARHVAAALLTVCPVPLATLAQQPESTPGDKSRYTLFNPTPREQLRDLSTDRPDTTESAYTVDAGHVQVELSFADLSRDRRNSDTTETLAVAPVLLKVGLLNNVDLQVGLDPFTHERAKDRAATPAPTSTAEGLGDTIVRLKVNGWGNDGGDTAFAIMPFVKFPSATHALGNGNVEGGLILPMAAALPGDFSLGMMVKFDFIRSAADDRYVVDFVHTATLGHGLVGDLAGYLEYAGFANFSHDEPYRGYFDAGLTYGLSDDIQLDAGLRVGLTPAADNLGLFLGISIRL